MISRILTEFSQNQWIKQHLKERKLLTIKLLIIIKDQLITANIKKRQVDRPALIIED